MRRIRRRRRGLFRSLFCAIRGPRTLSLNRDDPALCRVCLLSSRYRSAAGVAAPGELSAKRTSAIGGRIRDANKYEQIKRITLSKSELFDCTIYISCMVAVWQAEASVAVREGVTPNEKDNRKRLSADCTKRSLG